jgi:hypothetical protein
MKLESIHKAGGATLNHGRAVKGLKVKTSLRGPRVKSSLKAGLCCAGDNHNQTVARVTA